jgi:hypothetical protein
LTRQIGQRGQQSGGLGVQPILSGSQQVAKPQGKTIDQKTMSWGSVAAQRTRKIQRFLDQAPLSGPFGAMPSNALGHFRITHFGSGEINDP